MDKTTEELFFSFSSLPVLLYILSFIALVIVLIYSKRRQKKKLPPGPWKLPIIGNLHQMILGGALPHRTLKKLSDGIGPLMTMKMGERTTIVVTSSRMAKLVLQTNGLAVANRPVDSVAEVICYNSLGTTFAQHGEYLQQLRQLYMLELLSRKRVESFWGIFEDELVTKFAESIKSELGKPIVIYGKMTKSLYSAICRVAFGSEYGWGEQIISVCKRVAKLSDNPLKLEVLFPSMKFLACFTGRKLAVLKGLVKELDQVFDTLIGERENSESAGDEGDLLSILLKIKKGGIFKSKLQLTNNDIKAIIFELILTTTLSIADVVEWVMVEIMRHPEVLTNVKDEVRQVLKEKKSVSGSDLEHMEYLHMCIQEAKRLHPIAPLLFPREAKDEFTIEEYSIPKGSWIWVNFWAIGRDPENWSNPEQFDPERFRNSNIDYYGTHFEFIPFGAGRRLCPGIIFGVTEVKFLLAALLYHFDWKIPSGIKPEEIDITESFSPGCTLKNSSTLIPLLADS